MRNADRQAGPRSGRRDGPWRITYEPAGIIGVDLGPLTLRELLWIAEARGREAWACTSAIPALIANVNRDPKKDPTLTPCDFDAYSAREKHDEAIEVRDTAILRTLSTPDGEE